LELFLFPSGHGISLLDWRHALLDLAASSPLLLLHLLFPLSQDHQVADCASGDDLRLVMSDVHWRADDSCLDFFFEDVWEEIIV